MQTTRRDEIIFTSMQVFLKQGYHNTSMDDLAKACGLKKGSFYYHFENKEALMHSALNAVNTFFQKKVFSIAYQEELTPMERLEQMHEKSYKIFASTNQGCLMGNSVLETVSVLPVFKEVLKDFFESWAASLTTIFESKYPQDKAKELAWQAVQEIEGAIMMVRLFENTDFLKTTYQRILKYL